MRILFYGLGFRAIDDAGRLAGDAPAHYRLQLPCEALREQGGHESSIVGALSSDPRSGRLVGETLSGELVTDAPVLVLAAYVPAEAIRAARRAGQVVICDVTDTPEVPESSLYYDLVESMRPAAMAMYLAADALSVSSAYLGDYFASLPQHPSVHLLRNALCVSEWGPPAAISDKPTLGWCGTLLERADDVSVLRPWLGKFLEQHDLGFIHVGDGAMGVPGLVRTPPSFAEAAGIDPARVEARPVRIFADYLATRPWSGIDLQLIPLVDQHYSRGKSCLKGLESAAQGIAFVASPHPEYRWLGCGRLAGSDLSDQSPQVWVAALEEALDPSARRTMAGAARARVAGEDISRRWPEWEAVYEETLARRSAPKAADD